MIANRISEFPSAIGHTGLTAILLHNFDNDNSKVPLKTICMKILFYLDINLITYCLSDKYRYLNASSRA